MVNAIYNSLKLVFLLAVSLLPHDYARAAEPVPTEIVDGAGRHVAVKDTSRVVAIGGSITEILYALGLQDRIVAVDTTSVFPPQALKDKPDVGYMRALSAEGVLALGPSLVLAMEGSGPPATINVLQQASVPFLLVPEGHDAAGVAAKIRFVAHAMGVDEKGEALARAVAEDFAALEAMRTRIKEPRGAVFVMSMGGGSPMVGGAGTGADAAFKLAGVTNAMGAITGYKPASGEAVLAVEPYAVVKMGQGGGAADALLQLPAFATPPAARDKRLIPVDGAYLLAFGPRTPQAARDLAAAIYPELDLPKLPERAWTRTPGSAQ
ncbi:heme/hemin ABC transporter substrate-binding protein [Ancylobacter oerskovii]|uniref:Hemin ABC transporter substrate-binding protein n=1 Tax=Ancylobacter oerskovii TaxID=459519 RepID=A0ABW4Z0F7_9HYPH|nr:ABC transporter substrate-binding protein [Ancylobacter oerskovii]MBS7542860.1 ABC transporter substrate-binding protein [Ancylobacter oerskovii]